MSSRPRLKKHVQPLRRGPGSLQLGLRPDTGVVLDGLSSAEIAMVESLDGSRDIPSLCAMALAGGVPADRVSGLLATLNQHHLLIGTPTDHTCVPPTDSPRRHPPRPDATVTATAIAEAYGLAGDGFDYVAARSAQRVVISGEGDLPYALASLLRVGGIGHVAIGANSVNTLDLELRGRQGRGGQGTFAADHDPAAGPDLVVLTATGAIRADAGEPWLRRGIPHLPLVVQPHRVQIGPLITSGAGPCLSCMDLHRRDRDAAWPALLSQLSPGWPLRPGTPVSLEGTLTAMTVGVAAMIVHTRLDGQPVPCDVSLELSLPWPEIVSRRWFRHPQCECANGHATIAG